VLTSNYLYLLQVKSGNSYIGYNNISSGYLQKTSGGLGSTFESPRLPASGFEYVWIDGIPTLEKGERTSFVPGKGIRR
jgi:hypothetical protein